MNQSMEKDLFEDELIILKNHLLQPYLFEESVPKRVIFSFPFYFWQDPDSFSRLWKHHPSLQLSSTV